MLKYRMNLVKTIRAIEARDRSYKMCITVILAVSFALLAASGLYLFTRVAKVERVLSAERDKLRKIEAEYKNYQSTESIVEKADIELLNRIQSNRIYWTRKLESMANHLPAETPTTSYWITRFSYSGTQNTFTVSGFGYITSEQEQLLTLDKYMNDLRRDPNYNSVFDRTYLRSVVRNDEGAGGIGSRRGGPVRERVSFQYVSQKREQTRGRK